MRILFGYSHFPHPVDIQVRNEAWLQRLRAAGFDVNGFVLTLNPPAPRLNWDDLDMRWRYGNRELLEMYERLAREAENYDVFFNCTGINTHPDFVRHLPTFNVYCCYDDPESSENLSRPIAPAYDMAMVGNIACLELYRNWGIEEVHWWPIGFHTHDFFPEMTEAQVAGQQRDLDISLLCERESKWRDQRVGRFIEAFPGGAYYGRGWPNGFLPEEQRVPLYLKTKIGPNFHNSVGPVNSRTFVLPANGVMQICDNKSFLGDIFELGKEAVGFDNVEDAIDVCRYYLAHPEERLEIAMAGWRRVHDEYNEISLFSNLVTLIEKKILFSKKTKSYHPMRAIARKRWVEHCRIARHFFIKQFWLNKD